MVICYYQLHPMFQGDMSHGHVARYRNDISHGVRMVDICDSPSDCVWIIPNSDFEEIETLKLIVEF